ncbi:MAG: hypothetical protein MNPFHGCM_00339 [Gemmatimonadaceae bacterium]|nr:hypothetical protein [Gemmatimonadaceae bacterium]
MPIASLRERLVELSLDVEIEIRDRQLILIPRGRDAAFHDSGVRQEVVEIARSVGFTHVSVEIIDADHASLRCDQPA